MSLPEHMYVCMPTTCVWSGHEGRGTRCVLLISWAAVCMWADGFQRRASVAGRRDSSPVCLRSQVSRRRRDAGLGSKSCLAPSQAPTFASELAPRKTTVGSAGGSRTCARGGAPAFAAAASRRHAARSSAPECSVSPLVRPQRLSRRQSCDRV